MTGEEDQLPREARVRALVAAALALLLVTALVSIGAVAYLTVRAADSSEEATSQSIDNSVELRELQAISKRLVDCTEPGGECFEAAQKRTGEAIVGINEGTLAVIVAAISCQGDGITEKRALARCTVRRAR